jgi:hypothetical protein
LVDNQKGSIDEWELKLQDRDRELKACQTQLGLKSCLECSNLLNCKIRDSFVHAVYSSMNKGAGGGFEF